MRIIAFATLFLLLFAGAAARAQTPPFEAFVTRRGDQLYEGDNQLRFVSFNIPNLFVIEDAFGFLDDAPWRWPNEFEIADALESVRQMGGGVVRSYVISVRREGSDMGDKVHVLAPGVFNEDAFAAIDQVLKIANEKKIRVIIPLVDNWKWMGGAEQYAAFRGKREKDFWTDRQLIDDFKRTIEYVVNRRNALTGQPYREDKAILGWETGNEVDAPPEWTAEIAAYLKQLDANHLVIDGRSLHGVPAASLDDPNVDVVTTHHYPARGVDPVERVEAAAAAARGRKPYFVGEVGFISLDETRRVLDAAINSNAAGLLYWSLRFHRREGGYYWHSETTADRLIKAYHWPGFATGDGYDERAILDLLVQGAARIRGQQPAPKQAPQPATLLPIEHPGRISWQGSTGAAGYNVERAPAAAGPWRTIAEDVPDVSTQYRPLFCDASIEPGHNYFYRVTAINGAGAAKPSNVVGPVNVPNRLLVDELNDDTLIHAVAGAVHPRATAPRRTQEDAHRMELGPGGSLTYKLPATLNEVAVWMFAPDAKASCSLSASRDGVAFVPLKTTASRGQPGPSDYGYLHPALISARVDLPEARYLRIANAAAPQVAPAGAGKNGEDKNHQPFEVSRVEISYGRP